MPTIEFSSALSNTIPTAMFGVGVVNLSQPWFGHNVPLFSYAQASSYPDVFLRIMQGSVPTDFSTLTTAISRQSDRLMTFSGNIWTMTSSANPATIVSSSYATASASGTATWFLLQHTTSGSTTTFLHQMLGTVGATGSGADLEISNTNIVSGQFYRINSLKLGFPSSYTY